MDGKRTKLRLISALALLASAPALLLALDWPLSSPRPAAFFGTSEGGSFLTGIELSAEQSLVTSVDDGEVVFIFDDDPSSTGGSKLPSAIGSYIVVEHPRGMAGLYAEIEKGSVSSYLSKVKRGAILGKTGASGIQKGKGLAFSLFDRGASRWVNPLLLLPQYLDKTAPLIRSAALVRDGKSYPLGETKTLPQGQYGVAVDVVDLVDSPWTPGPSAPYYIRLVVDGAKAAELQFDVAEARTGKLRVSSISPKSYEECRLPDGKTLLASRLFPRGKSVILILVRDYAGNERQASWTIGLE